MKKVIATAGAAGLAALAFQTADAAVLSGTISKTANTCPTAIGAINGDDCSYNDSFTQPGYDPGGGVVIDPWVGPDRGTGFYASSLAANPTLDWTREPTPGDGKVSPHVTFNLTIGAGNLVSGTIVIGPVAISNFSSGPGGRGEDSWTAATITLVAKAADSVVGNTLIIGSAGYPQYLQASNASDQFPSETGADSNNSGAGPDQLWWAGPEPSGIGITNVEGNTGTTGTMAVADVVGWTCNDVNGNPADGACSSSSSFRGRGNFENILLKITKNAFGIPAAVEGFLVQGGQGTPNPATTPNWVAWTFTATLDTDGDGTADATDTDDDNDTLADTADNCTLVANNDAGNVTGTTVPRAQLDADNDGYGNNCDADINNSGSTTTTDYTLLRNVLNQNWAGGTLSTPPCTTTNICKADMNGSGSVTTADYTLLRNRLNTAPGPSGFH